MINIIKLFLIAPVIFLISCAPSQKEKEEISIITCNIVRDSKLLDATTRIKEVNHAREKIKEEKFLLPDSKIIESIKYGLCEELVLNDPEYETKLGIAVAEEESRLEAIRQENLRLERLRLEKEALERERRLAAVAEAKKQREERDRLRREKEEEEIKKAEEEKRIAKEREEESKRLPKQLWRKEIEKVVVTPTIMNVTARIFRFGNSGTIDVETTCQQGIRTRMFVEFKSLIPDLKLENSTGYCSGRTYKFSKYIKNDTEEYKQLLDKLDLLPTIRVYSDKSEQKDLSSYLIQDVDIEIYGAWRPDNKDIDPRQFPPLGESEKLNEPIKMKANFGRWLSNIK